MEGLGMHDLPFISVILEAVEALLLLGIQCILKTKDLYQKNKENDQVSPQVCKTKGHGDNTSKGLQNTKIISGLAYFVGSSSYAMKRLSFFSFLIFFASLSLVRRSFAQGNVWDNAKEQKGKAAGKLSDGKSGFKKWKEHIEQWGREDKYTNHLALGVKLNSNGWSGCVYYLKRAGVTDHHLWQLSFSEIKHEKQLKQQKGNTAYPQFGAASPFVFGKINNLYVLQLGYGRERLLLPGVIEGNLSVSFRYSGGFSLALLKPYYLKLVYTDYANNHPPVMKEERWMDSNHEQFLNTNSILGASKWGTGLEETHPVPGVYGEAAVAIEVDESKFLVQTITIGANAGYYPDKLPIMAELPASNLQTAVFVGLSLGKKWRKRY